MIICLLALKVQWKMGDDIDVGSSEEVISAAEESDIESEEEAEEPSSQQVHDYNDSERYHDIALAIYQHVSCFTHTLQLVVHTYDNDVSSNLKGAISKLKKLTNW